MVSLIENILSIENQANETIANAQAEAKAMEKTTLTQIDQIKNEIRQNVDRRIETFRQQASEKNQAALAVEKEQAQHQLAALDQVDPAKVHNLAALVVARFQER